MRGLLKSVEGGVGRLWTHYEGHGIGLSVFKGSVRLWKYWGTMERLRNWCEGIAEGMDTVAGCMMVHDYEGLFRAMAIYSSG